MEIDLGACGFDIDFHPSAQLVAAGLITGYLHLYRYAAATDDDSPPERVLKVRVHRESCRASKFINDGRVILTGSPDHSIRAIDVETGSVIGRRKEAHGHAINAIINLTSSTVASGDDGGCIKVWDIRQLDCCNTFTGHQEFISDMAFSADSMKLLATCGDGSLSVCDLRRNEANTAFKKEKSQCTSESPEEATSVVILKNGQKVVCSSNRGNLLLYAWGCFEDYSDRFDISTNPVDSVDTLLKLDEDTIIAGSGTGLISLVRILPNRVLKKISVSEFPVDRLACSHEKKFLGSLSDEILKLWHTDEILQSSETSLSTDEMDLDNDPSKYTLGNRGNHHQNDGSQQFFADLEMDC